MSRCEELAHWPMCTQECGLLLEDEHVPALQNQLVEEDDIRYWTLHTRDSFSVHAAH